MTLLSPNHNHAADECIAQIPQHHIPTQEEKVRASETFDKSVLVAAHMAALHDAYILEMATHPVNEVNIKPASPTSSIGGLKPSTLKQLKIGKVHRRRVVNGTLCSRTLCTKTSDGLMVVNVLEDEEGNATPIYLCNAMEGNGGSAQAQRCYPQDSKVAVKEPYLTRLPDGEVVLMVEKMTDLVFLWVPDHVEENGGSNGHGMDGRDVFAMEKKGDEDGDDKTKTPINGDTFNNNDTPVDPAAEEDEKSSSASRELKFDDSVGRKESEVKSGDEDGGGKTPSNDDTFNNNDTPVDPAAEEDEKSSSASRELKFDDAAGRKESEVKSGDEDGGGKTPNNDDTFNNNDTSVDPAAEEDEKSSSASRELKFDDAFGRKESEKSVMAADGENFQNDAASGAEKDAPDAGVNAESRVEDVVDQVEVKDQVNQLAKTGEASSREFNMEDIKSLKNNTGDTGDVEKAKDGDGKENQVTGDLEKGKDGDGKENKVLEMTVEESRVEALEEGTAAEDVVEQEAQEGKCGGDVDAGETSASLRIKGNALFARGEFNKAIDVYTRAAENARMDGLKKEELLCLSNRAEVWLRLCRNQVALDDAEAALKLLRELEEDSSAKGDLDLAPAKALFRKGRALMGLHKYEDAMRVLQEVLGKAPADRQLREAAIKCRDHLRRVLKPGKKQRAAMNRKKSASFMMQ